MNNHALLLRLRRVPSWPALDAVGSTLLALLLLALLLAQPWQMHATVGGTQDSPWLGAGFYTKEHSENGLYRWTTGSAIVQLPEISSAYLVDLELSRGPLPAGGGAQLQDGARPVVTLPITATFRRYQVLWAPRPPWFGADSQVALTIRSAAATIPGGDTRRLGVVMRQLGAAAIGGPSSAPLIWVGLGLLGLWGATRGLRHRGWWYGIGTVALVLIDGIVGWRLLGGASVWVPWLALPALLTLTLVGVALTRWNPDARWGRWLPLLLLGGLLVALLVTVTRQWSVEGPDFAWHLSHGDSLRTVFRAHEFYPFGFPLILWLGQQFAHNPLAAGRLAALLSTVGVWATTVTLAWRIGGPRMARWAGLLLLASPVFLGYGVLASTDSVQLLPLLLALLVVGWERRLTHRRLLLSGLLLGIAYLFRFQALLIVGLVSLWLLMQPPQLAVARAPLRLQAWAGRGLAIALLVAGFVAGAAPQWVFDIRDTGRPFYSKQYENIWQAAYARTDAVTSADADLGQAAIAGHTGLFDIVAFDPYTLGRHWLGNLHEFWSVTLHQLFVWPIGLLVVVALALILIRPADPRLQLAALIIGLYIPIIALTWNKDRFYLPLIPLAALLGAWVLPQLARAGVTIGGRRLRFGGLITVLLVVWVLQHLGALEQLLPVYGQRLP